jgi:hypothetical protein
MLPEVAWWWYWRGGVTGEGGHLGQIARNSNSVILKNGSRKLKNGVNTTTA